MTKNKEPQMRYKLPLVLTIAFIGIAVIATIATAQFSWFSGRKPLTPKYQSKLSLSDIPFDGQQAMTYLKALCDIGPRCTGSEGMARQQEYIINHFKQFDCTVERQRFNYPHPITKEKTLGCNIIVRWRPERTERILLCTHYDTLPFPMMDKKDPKGRFVGANDGGSGTALLMELARWINEGQKDSAITTPGAYAINPKYGVDFVFLDAEEFLFSRNGRYFVGSEFFSIQYANNPNRGYRYVKGVLLDMVADSDLQIYYEKLSMSWRDSAPIAREIWKVAAGLKIKEFIPATKYEISDDHIMIHSRGAIPCIDIIDFDYPYWHTTQDVPANCSALSLAKVGWVIAQWLKETK